MVNISCLPLMWERAFPEPTYRGCPVSFSEEESPMDSGGGVKKIMPWVKPGEPLLVHNGDILTDIPVADKQNLRHINFSFFIAEKLRASANLRQSFRTLRC